MKKILLLLFIFLLVGCGKQEDSIWRIDKGSCMAFHIGLNSVGTHYSCGVCNILYPDEEQLVCAVPTGGDNGYYNSSETEIYIYFDKDEKQMKVCAYDECYTKKEALERKIITEFSNDKTIYKEEKCN